MYGYDAGVLGGVQETEPFRKAMGVSSEPSHVVVPSLTPNVASNWNLCHTHDRVILHACCCGVFIDGNHDRYALGTTQLHSSWQCVCYRWRESASFVLVCGPDDCWSYCLCKFPIIVVAGYRIDTNKKYRDLVSG